MIQAEKNYIFYVLFIFLIIVETLFSLSLCSPDESKNKNEQNILWKEDFKSGELTGWKVIDDISDAQSNWFVEDGYLIQDTDTGSKSKLIGTNIIYENAKWDNCTIRANIVGSDDDYIGILFRYKDNDNYYRMILSTEAKEIRVDRKLDGKFDNLAVINDEWEYVKFSVTIILKSEAIKIYLNDVKYFELSDNHITTGNIGFTCISNLGSFFDDIIVYSDYRIIPAKIEQEITRGPYLQNVLGDSATVMWRTSHLAISQIEYGITKDLTSTVTSDELVLNHELEIKGLIPETIYFYRIKTVEFNSDWFTFKSAINEGTPFSIIIYGDNQMNFLRHSEITNQIAKHNFDLIISCGDVVQNGNRDDWDVEFFNPLKNLLTQKPIYAAIGNHELNSENYYLNFSNPNQQHENYYSFKYGNAYFIFLDNPKAGYPDKEYYNDFIPGSAQYEWFEKEVASDAAQNAEWLFVISHIPGYAAGSQDNYPSIKKHIIPLLEEYDVDFSFSGHLHGYERGEVNNVNYIITAGGGGAQNKKNVSKLKQFPSFKLVYNFCRIDINDKALKIKVYNEQNLLIDELSIVH